MKAILSRFTPSIMPHEDLEAIFVQREKLVERLVELVRDSALTPSKHQTLLIGPRGVGKTHIIALVYHRIRKMEDLGERLMIAWLREEEWGVTSFLDLLLRVFRSLMEEEKYYDAEIAERVESLYLHPETAEYIATKLLKEFVGDRALLILAENLEDLFDGLGDEGQKQLRAYLQENPFCTILATAQSLFNGVSLQTSPFYGFFRIHHLEDLALDEATDLLKKIADLVGDRELSSFVGTPRGRSRIRAVHHLAGGNHRVYVIFSDFLTRESLDELVDSVMRTLDDLTPYYQARMRWLSAQQRKIVEFLCSNRGAVPVKEIAGRCFMTQQTASSQLKDLREKGYVSSDSVGRESYYELRESLMRLCGEVKKQRGDPIRLLVDFLRLWHSREELQERLALLGADAGLEREYFLHALQAVEEGPDPRVVACLKDCKAYVEAGDFIRALEVAEELVEIRGEAADWYLQAYCLTKLHRWSEALVALDKAIELNSDYESAWVVRGVTLSQVGRYEDMLASFDRAIELEPDDAMNWLGRGIALGMLGSLEKALASYDKAIELGLNHDTLWDYRGRTLHKLGRYEESLECYEKVIELNPSNAMTWANRGSVLYTLKRFNEALASYDKAIEINQEYAAAWVHRGLALDELGRSDEAQTSLEKSIEVDRGNSLGWHARGVTLGILKRWDEALASFEKAIELGERTSAIFFNCAATLLALNRWDEGITALDDALQRFAHADHPDTGDTELIVRNVFTGKLDAATWRTRGELLMETYGKHQVLAELGQGLVRSIRALNSAMMSDAAAREWLEIWKELAGDRDEFQIPLRLLDAAVNYRETKDRRVLLRLAVEERKILEPLLEGIDA